jgi:hypothetical protein
VIDGVFLFRYTYKGCARMAELVDAQVSKTCGSNTMPVRFRLLAPVQLLRLLKREAPDFGASLFNIEFEE